jgi:hypothetical protein
MMSEQTLGIALQLSLNIRSLIQHCTVCVTHREPKMDTVTIRADVCRYISAVIIM